MIARNQSGTAETGPGRRNRGLYLLALVSLAIVLVAGVLSSYLESRLADDITKGEAPAYRLSRDLLENQRSIGQAFERAILLLDEKFVDGDAEMLLIREPLGEVSSDEERQRIEESIQQQTEARELLAEQADDPSGASVSKLDPGRLFLDDGNGSLVVERQEQSAADYANEFRELLSQARALPQLDEDMDLDQVEQSFERYLQSMKRAVRASIQGLEALNSLDGEDDTDEMNQLFAELEENLNVLREARLAELDLQQDLNLLLEQQAQDMEQAFAAADSRRTVSSLITLLFIMIMLVVPLMYGWVR
ncbi:MAG: hypothetical protein AAGD01_14700 [Acidobacteriota bacterium]